VDEYIDKNMLNTDETIERDDSPNDDDKQDFMARHVKARSAHINDIKEIIQSSDNRINSLISNMYQQPQLNNKKNEILNKKHATRQVDVKMNFK